MKPGFILFWILAFCLPAFSQKSSPIPSGELIKTADQLYDSGYYKKSLALYEQIDRNDTNYVKCLYGKAQNFVADSQFNKAIPLFEKALQLKDQRELEPDIYNSYGSALIGNGESEKAATVFSDGIKKYPSYSILYFNKGVNLFQQERYKEAEEVFKETLLINPYQYSAHYYLGQCAIREGKIVPAFLSFAGYLLVNPGGKYFQRCINILSAIGNSKDEILEYKNKRTEEGEESYALAEEILLSKIALEKDYKLKVSFDDPIFRQLQVVFEKLDFKEEDTDFWMQYYVPYFKKLFNDNQFEPYIFWSFENVTLKEIQDYNKKNKKAIEQFTRQTAEYFDDIRATRLLAFNKRADQHVRYLYSNGELQGRGEKSSDGNYIGSWTFYYSPGNIKSAGQFNKQGRDGNWTFYFFSGNLDARESYLNGKQNGKQLYYSERGIPTYEQTSLNGQANGLLFTYFVNGRVFSTTSYKSGKIEEEYKDYYQGGQINAVKHYINNALSGSFISYFENGQVKDSGNYLNGSLDGPYKEFYENGQLSQEGIFKNGSSEGMWTNYYDNGKIKSTSPYVNLKLEGEQKEFYEDGQLEAKYTYKKGLLAGESISFDKDQTVFAKFKFNDNKLESAAYFDKTGKQISLSETKNNRLELDILRPDGTKSTHREFNEKGQFDGPETRYLQSGKISQVVEYKDGEKNGTVTEYFPNGKKKSEQAFKNGKQEGQYISWFVNGKIESEGWCDQGDAVGVWNYYSENGNLNNRSYMLAGQITGYKTEYYSNGSISIEKKFYKSQLEEMRQFDSTGKLLIYDSFPQFSGKFLLLYPDGHKMQECNYVKGMFDGPLVQYYFDGSVQFIQNYKGGLLDSDYVAYHFNHMKAAEGKYTAGKKMGLWKYYSEDGPLEYTINYAYDELSGLRQYYDANGKIGGSISYRHDARNGVATNTDPDGSLLYNVSYEDGMVMGYSYLNKEGKPVPEIKAERGKLKVESFFQNGKPSRQCQFIDGKLNGSDIIYFANGKIKSQDSSANGLYEGSSKEYYPNGNPKKICSYQNSNLSGPCLEYNEQGVLIRNSNYYDGDRQGEAKYYSEKGVLLETRFYYDGILLAVKK